jgi:hypothetical protein
MNEFVEATLSVEDIGSLILFIDHFIPMMDMTDPDSRDTADNVLRARENLRKTVDPEGVIFQKSTFITEKN